MKIFFLLSLLLLTTGCSTVAHNNSSSTLKSPSGYTLKRSMAYGLIHDLGEYSPDIDKNLLVRIFEIPPQNDDECFIETSGVCRYEHILSISTFDEYPVFDVVDLDIKGKIKNVRWNKTDEIDSAWISFEISSYTDEAMTNNPRLENIVNQLDIHISVNGETAMVRANKIGQEHTSSKGHP